jgi:RimJ/RimL family protein N-acetyltransferase
MQKYSFQTKRLGFRFLQKADLDYLVELNVDPDVRQFFPDGVQNRKQTDYIIAFAPVEHVASARVMQKCGMQHYKNDNAKGVACCFYRIRNI